MKTATHTIYAYTSQNITSVEFQIASLESEATKSASRLEPDTAHIMRKSYEEICEDIIMLKKHLNGLRLKLREEAQNFEDFPGRAA